MDISIGPEYPSRMGIQLSKLLTRVRNRIEYRKYKIKSFCSKLYQKLAPASLTIFGLTSFTIAAFQFAIIGGFIILGVSFFYLEWRLDK